MLSSGREAQSIHWTSLLRPQPETTTDWAGQSARGRFSSSHRTRGLTQKKKWAHQPETKQCSPHHMTSITIFLSSLGSHMRTIPASQLVKVPMSGVYPDYVVQNQQMIYKNKLCRGMLASVQVFLSGNAAACTWWLTTEKIPHIEN